MKWKVLLLFTLLTSSYIILGGVIFHFLEGEQEEVAYKETKEFNRDFLANFSCVNQDEVESFVNHIIHAYQQGIITINTSEEQPTRWDIRNAMFFSTTVITTIGYGHMSPATKIGQTVCIFYAIFGIPLFIIFLTGITEKLSLFGDWVEHVVTRADVTNTKTRRICRVLITTMVNLVLWLFIPAVIFSHMEGWDYSTSLYFAVVTMTTVGFGDYVPGTNELSRSAKVWYRPMIAVWVTISLAAWVLLATKLQLLWKEVLPSKDRKTGVEPDSKNGHNAEGLLTNKTVDEKTRLAFPRGRTSNNNDINGETNITAHL